MLRTLLVLVVLVVLVGKGSRVRTAPLELVLSP